MSGYTDLLDERRRRRTRVLAVVGLLVFVAAVWKLTSVGEESIEDEATSEPYQRFGAWLAYENPFDDFNALFALPDGCVLAVGGDTGEIVIRTLGPDEGLACAAPRDDSETVASMPVTTDGVADLPAATRFGDGYALLVTTSYDKDTRATAVITGTPGAWRHHPLGTVVDAGAIAWDGTDLVVLGADADGPVVWRSPDGGTWREERLPGGEPESGGFLLASDGRGTTLAAATTGDADAETSRLWRSDGAGWAEVSPVEGTGAYLDIAYDGSSFQLVGSYHDTAGRLGPLVAASEDGRGWTIEPGFWRAGEVRAVVAAPGQPLMVFTDGIETADGVCEAAFHRRTAGTFDGEPFDCENRVADAVALPDGRVVAVAHGRVYVREAV